MKFRNIFWGIILIAFGILFTLENLNFIDFDWYNLWRLWPVVIILWGVSILPVKDVLKVFMVLLVLAGSIYYMLNDNVQWRNADHDYTEISSHAVNQEFQVPLEDSVLTATLKMEMAAGTFDLRDITDQLVDFKKTGSIIDYKYSVKQEDTDTKIRIMMEDNIRYKSNNGNRVVVKLNPDPVWNLDFEVGAAEVNLDFSDFKVNSVDIEGGAAAFNLKFGDLYHDIHVDIEAGASSIDLKVPESSGCQLKINTVLSGRTISGFEKVEHGLYRTANFDESENKIYMEVDAAVSSYTITRY
ncbi:MAG: hypothetical protein KKF98_11545 [Bacteroidetes bacterium]|nr:hypothetical protein [Bacteroidota bacterium]